MKYFGFQSLNVALFYDNKDPRSYISLVPTSAHSGDGMGNLMALVVELSQTMLAKRVAFSEKLQASVMEVILFCLKKTSEIRIFSLIQESYCKTHLVRTCL